MQKFWEDFKSYSTLFKCLFIKRNPLCNRENSLCENTISAVRNCRNLQAEILVNDCSINFS